MTTRDYIDEVEVQLTSAAESGRGRRRPGRDALAVAPALLAVAAVIAVLVLVVGGGGGGAGGVHAPVRQTAAHGARHRHTGTVHHGHATVGQRLNVAPLQTPTTRTATQTAPGGPVPAGFQPSSFTAISDTTWWLMGQAPCSSPPCTSIVRTDDGGASFVGIPAPRTDQVSQVRFADASDGFAFGPQLWVTHDMGRTWTQLDLNGSVTDLETSGGYVYATVTASSGATVLERSLVGGGLWTSLGPSAPWGLWVQGSQVLVGGDSPAGSSLRLSAHDGSDPATVAAPPSVACNYEIADGVIWAPCATGTMSGVWRSTDEGAHWSGVGGDAVRSGQPPEPNSAAFGAASATIAVYGYNQLYLTTDAGATWTKTGPSGISYWRYVGFTDPTHGVAIGQTAGGAERLYYTTDAGSTYTQVTP